MEVTVPASLGSRRDEDIALDLMKFVASTSGYGKAGAAGLGFQGNVSANAADDYAKHLLELYGRCLDAVQGKK